MSQTPLEQEKTASLGWDSLGLSSTSLEQVRSAGFTRPTEVQVKSLPIAMAGKDLIASSETGSGKTAAFVLPMIERIAGRDGLYGLILAPTRELVLQIQETLVKFGGPRGVKSISLIGGTNVRTDEDELRSYPHIIAATPGRLCDHLDRGNIWLEFIEVLVLDEADRMLDMGFSAQLERINRSLPKQRQTLLFSATIPPAVDELARKLLHHPQRITIGKPVGTASRVEQTFVWMHEEEKHEALKKILREERGSMLVFTRSKAGAAKLWRSLYHRGMKDIAYLSSDLEQNIREQVLAQFKTGEMRVLIATDVASRGLHVEDVMHVVNYDFPREAEDYVHRIGRTGRAGASGKATSFLTRHDRPVAADVEAVSAQHIKQIGTPPQAVHAHGDHSHGHRPQSRRGGRNRGRRRRGSSSPSHS